MVGARFKADVSLTTDKAKKSDIVKAWDEFKKDPALAVQVKVQLGGTLSPKPTIINEAGVDTKLTVSESLGAKINGTGFAVVKEMGDNGKLKGYFEVAATVGGDIKSTQIYKKEAKVKKEFTGGANKYSN